MPPTKFIQQPIFEFGYDTCAQQIWHFRSQQVFKAGILENSQVFKSKNTVFIKEYQPGITMQLSKRVVSVAADFV